MARRSAIVVSCDNCGRIAAADDWDTFVPDWFVVTPGPHDLCSHGCLEHFARNMPDKSASVETEPIKLDRNGNKKKPCVICGMLLSPQGVTPHMRMHERKGETASQLAFE